MGKDRTLQRWFLSSKEEEVSKSGRVHCLLAGPACLHQLEGELRWWGQTGHTSCRQLRSGKKNISPHAKLETTACCCHNIHSFMLMVSLRQRVVFFNYFNRTQLFPGFWARSVPKALTAIQPPALEGLWSNSFSFSLDQKLWIKMKIKKIQPASAN